MATDLFLTLRREVVAHLKGYSPLTAVVSAANIHGEQPKSDPAWPFIRIGLAETASYEAQGLDGSEHPFVIHAFAHGPFTDQVQVITALVVDAMNAFEFSGYLVACEFVGATTLRDTDEANAYHSVITFQIAVAERV